LAQDAARLGVGDRHRLSAGPPPPETPDPWGVFSPRPGLVAEIHLPQDVAREELALGLDLGAPADLDDLLGRHDHLGDFLAQAFLFSLLADRLGDLVLEARIVVNDEPTTRHFREPRAAASRRSR